MRKVIAFVAGLMVSAGLMAATDTPTPTLTHTPTPTLTVFGAVAGGEHLTDKQVLNDVWDQTNKVLGTGGAVGVGTPIAGKPNVVAGQDAAGAATVPNVEADSGKNAQYVQSNSMASASNQLTQVSNQLTMEATLDSILEKAVTILSELEALGDKAVTIDTDSVHLSTPKLTTSVSLLDVSKDAQFSNPIAWNGGFGGAALPESRTSGQVIFYLYSANSGDGGLEAMPGIDAADYVAMLHMGEDASNTTVNDHSVKANTFTSMANTDTMDTLSRDGLGFEFNGTTDYLTRADDDDFDVAIDESVVCGIWFKHDTAVDTEGLFRRWIGTGGWLLNMTATGELQCYISDDSNATHDTCTTASAYDDNEWHRVKLVVEGRSNLRIYVDGVEDASVALSNCVGAIDGDAAFTVGEGTNATQRWTGSLDGLSVAIGPDYPSVSEVEAYWALIGGTRHIAYGIMEDGTTNTLLLSSGNHSTAQYVDLNKYLWAWTGYIRLRFNPSETVDKTSTFHHSN